jgi:hypothetical protein
VEGEAANRVHTCRTFSLASKHPHRRSFHTSDARAPPRVLFLSSPSYIFRLLSYSLHSFFTPLLSHQYASVATFFVAFRRSVTCTGAAPRSRSLLTARQLWSHYQSRTLQKFDIYGSVSTLSLPVPPHPHTFSHSGPPPPPRHPRVVVRATHPHHHHHRSPLQPFEFAAWRHGDKS